MAERPSPANEPTERELQILGVLWRLGEASVREVYEELRDELPIVQNTVQAFLRTMTEKELVVFRQDGRRFLYRAKESPERTRKGLVSKLLDRAFDGAVDALVAKAFEARKPNADEIARLKEMLEDLEQGGSTKRRKA